MGKLIVIEGTDGSGKSTQFRRMSEHLEQEARIQILIGWNGQHKKQIGLTLP